jgi:putative transposase
MVQTNPDRSHPAHLPAMTVGFRSIIILVTFCTKGRKPILANGTVHELLKKCWADVSRWRVGRYVIMPDHIHLFCSPGAPDFPPLKVWMKFWRSEVSRHWPDCNDHPIWQPDFWDRQLRKEESYSAGWTYFRENPVRKNLCTRPEDWPYQGEMNVLSWHD